MYSRNNWNIKIGMYKCRPLSCCFKFLDFEVRTAQQSFEFNPSLKKWSEIKMMFPSTDAYPRNTYSHREHYDNTKQLKKLLMLVKTFQFFQLDKLRTARALDQPFQMIIVYRYRTYSHAGHIPHEIRFLTLHVEQSVIYPPSTMCFVSAECEILFIFIFHSVLQSSMWYVLFQTVHLSIGFGIIVQSIQDCVMVLRSMFTCII